MAASIVPQSSTAAELEAGATVGDELAPLRAFHAECATLAALLDRGVSVTPEQLDELESLPVLLADLTMYHLLDTQEREATVAAYAEPRRFRYPTRRAT